MACPGLWACLDPECTTSIDGAHSDGPDRQALRPAAATLRLRRPRLRVLHLPQLRLRVRPRLHRRSREPDVPLDEPGGAFQTRRGLVAELLAARPAAGGADPTTSKPAELDLVTGRLNPHEARRAVPAGLSPLPRASGDAADATTTTTPRHDSSHRRVQTLRRLRQSRRLRPHLGAGPPDQGRPAVPGAGHAADRGAAARAAASTTSRRCEGAKCWPSPTRVRRPPGWRRTCRPTPCSDVIRPLILRGLDASSSHSRCSRRTLSLEDLYLARPGRAPSCSVSGCDPSSRARRSLQAVTRCRRVLSTQGALDDPGEFDATACRCARTPPPQSLLRGIVTDAHRPLLRACSRSALASLRERGNLDDDVLAELPDIPGVRDDRRGEARAGPAVAVAVGTTRRHLVQPA